MKKIIVSICAMAAIVSSSFAQTAQEIIQNFSDKTKIASLDKTKTDNMYIKMVTEASGMKIPMTVIKSGTDKMRAEISAAGQNIVIVLDGQKAYMSIPGQGVQEIPEAMAKQQAGQSDILSMVTFDTKEYVYTLKEEKNGCFVVDQAKIEDPTKILKTLYFNKETAMLDDMEMSQEGMKMNVKMGQYKDFSGVLLPSVMNVDAAGQKVKMTVETIEFEYPAMPHMFVKPN